MCYILCILYLCYEACRYKQEGKPVFVVTTCHKVTCQQWLLPPTVFKMDLGLLGSPVWSSRPAAAPRQRYGETSRTYLPVCSLFHPSRPGWTRVTAAPSLSLWCQPQNSTINWVPMWRRTTSTPCWCNPLLLLMFFHGIWPKHCAAEVADGQYAEGNDNFRCRKWDFKTGTVPGDSMIPIAYNWVWFVSDLIVM